MSSRTWGTSLFYYALHYEVESLTEELPSPHVDDGYLTRDDGESSI